MRVLAVDPGEKRLGIAINDPSGTIAQPLTVIEHYSRDVDAATIAQLAIENEAKIIVVGQSLDEHGKPTRRGRSAARLAAAIRTQCDLGVELWDEEGSTQTARQARIELGVGREKRSGHLDELAATVILQSYLEAKRVSKEAKDNHE
jgi:putative Holliday junction resolvase